MYQDKAGDICGIWFCDEDDSVGISKQISRLVHAPGATKTRRQRCVSESDSQSTMKFKNGKSNDRDITSILTIAQMEFNQRNSSCTSLKSVPSVPSGLSCGLGSPSTEKSNVDQKTQPFMNGSSQKNQSIGSSSVTPRRRFPSSGTPVTKPACSKQLFESPSQDLSSVTPGISTHEVRSQFLKSRALSLDSTPKKNIFQEFLGKKQESDLESKSIFTKLAAGNFASSGNPIPEETSPPVMTPEMFEQTAMPAVGIRKTPCFDQPQDLHNSAAFPNCLNWKDQHTSGIHQMATALHSPSKSVYSPQHFQNIDDRDHGNGFMASDEPNCPTESTLACTDPHIPSREQLASPLMYLLSNDSSMLSKIHEAYISSLKTHLNSFKK